MDWLLLKILDVLLEWAFTRAWENRAYIFGCIWCGDHEDGAWKLNKLCRACEQGRKRIVLVNQEVS